MIRSHGWVSSAAARSVWVATVECSGVYPAWRKVRRRSSASSAESSTSRTFSLRMLGFRADRRFVEQQPIQSQLAGRFEELVEIHRLAHVGVAAEAVAGHQVLLLPRGGEHNHR